MNIGPAIPFDRTGLEQLSQVTPLEFQAARSLWLRAVPLRWKRLLESQTVGDPDPLNTPYVWDPGARRYIHLLSRRYVPFTQIRAQAIEPLILHTKGQMRALSAQLAAGDRSLAEWQQGMLNLIKPAHVATALAVNGGEENSSPVDTKKIAALILFYLLLFQNFAEELETGRQVLNGRLLVRSDLYASSARSIFEEMRRHGMSLYVGALRERRVLGLAEHCRTDKHRKGCVELAKMDWQRINSLPRLGDTPCWTNCKCRFEFQIRDSKGNWIVVKDSPTVAHILRRMRAITF